MNDQHLETMSNDEWLDYQAAQMTEEDAAAMDYSWGSAVMEPMAPAAETAYWAAMGMELGFAF